MFNEYKSTMQQQMSNQINEQLTKYVKIKDAQDAELRVSTRKLRSQHKQEEENANTSGQRKSRYGNGEEAPINFAITPAEIAQDLAFIQKDYVKNAKAFMTAAGMAGPAGKTKIPMVRIENGVLIVDDTRFHVGDRVELASEYTGEIFNGTITSINSSEMYCRLIDGSKARVYLKHIRNCRVKIELEAAKHDSR